MLSVLALPRVVTVLVTLRAPLVAVFQVVNLHVGWVYFWGAYIVLGATTSTVVPVVLVNMFISLVRLLGVIVLLG